MSPSSSSKQHRSLWDAAFGWWDVGASENDKNRQPSKLSDTLGMAWQLIAQEKKLMAMASLLMVSVQGCRRCSSVLLCNNTGRVVNRDSYQQSSWECY